MSAWKVKDNFLKAAQIIGVQIVELAIDESREIRSQIKKKFFDDSYGINLFSKLKEFKSIRIKNEWGEIKNFTKDKNLYIFFEDKETEQIFFLRESGTIVDLIDECYRFNFYFTDINLDFLICLNIYDYLIGSGSAMPWIEALELNRGTTNPGNDG